MRGPRFKVYEAKDGWRWRLLAANNRVLASGEGFTTKAHAERAVATVQATVERIGHKAMIERLQRDG